MAKKQETSAAEFVNPFTPGVSYDDFLKAKGSASVADYCSGHLSEEQIKWLENDLTYYKQ